MKLKYTCIAQIKNGDTLQESKYLTDPEMRTDQAVKFTKKESEGE